MSNDSLPGAPHAVLERIESYSAEIQRLLMEGLLGELRAFLEYVVILPDALADRHGTCKRPEPSYLMYFRPEASAETRHQSGLPEARP